MTRQQSRRRFLQRALSLSGGGALGAAFARGETFLSNSKPKSEPVSDQPQPIIDTHQHLWDLSKLTLSWLQGKDVTSLNRSFLTSDYLQATEGQNVVKAVYMEVDCDVEFQRKEAEYAIELCRRDDTPTVAAVISGRPNSKKFAPYIERFAESPWIKGVRQILHVDSAPRGLCLQRQFVESIQLLGELGLRFDLCMRPGEIIDGVKLVDQCPKTRFIVDHCGNMSVQTDGSRLRQTWMKGMREMAGRSNVVCKISGIIVTADKDSWKPADLEPNVTFCLDAFGEDRVLFAGDWPVCTLTASLAEWVAALKWIVRDRPANFQRKLFHDNAAAFYELS